MECANGLPPLCTSVSLSNSHFNLAKGHKVNIRSCSPHSLMFHCFTPSHNQRTANHFSCKKWNTSNYFTTEADQIALYSLVSAHNSFKSCFTACGSWPVKSSLSASFHHRPLFFMPSLCVGRELVRRCVAVVRGSEELCLQHQMETSRGDPHLDSSHCFA